MKMASTRSTRSRFSSPHRSSNGPLEPSKNSANNEGGKTFLDKWLEPTVQHRPSFEDHGLVRYGVVEGMAPLGEMPKATIQKRKGPEGGHNPVRKIILRQSTRPASSSPAPPTPTLPVLPVADASETRRAEGREEPKKKQVLGEEAVQPLKRAARDTPVASSEQPLPSSPPVVASLPPAVIERPARRSLPRGRGSDDEYAGAPARASAGSSRTPLPRRSLPRTSAGRRASGSQNLSERSTPVPAPLAPGTEVQPSAGHLPAPDKPAIDQVVEAAVDEAIRHYRYPTAWALRNLYDEKASDPDFLLLLESVFNQTAGSDALREFARLVHAKKREGKKDNQACYYFVPPTTNSRFTPHKAKHAPYRRYVTLDLAALRSPTDQATGEQLDLNLKIRQPVFTQPAIQQPAFKKPNLDDQQTEQQSKQSGKPDEPKQTEQREQPKVQQAEQQPDSQPQQRQRQEEEPEPQQQPQQLQSKKLVFSQPEAEVSPSKRKHHHRSSRRSRHAPHVGMDASAAAEGGLPATPSRRRVRRGSDSSDSSALSELENSPSLPSPTPVAKRDARLDVADPSGIDEMAPNDVRPIRRSRATVAAAAHQAADTSQPTSPTPAPTLAGDTTSNTTMPGRVSSPMFPNLTKGNKTSSAKVVAAANKKPSPPVSSATPPVAVAVAVTGDDYENLLSRRRDARAITRSKTPRVDSSVRSSAPAVASVGEPWEQLGVETPIATAKTRKTRTSNIGTASVAATTAASTTVGAAPSSTRVTRSVKRNFDEVDGAVSPSGSPSIPGDAASVANSRAATPSLMPAAKKQRTSGLRVKSSPVKKKGGTAAGLPRPSGEGHQFAANGVPNSTDDNDENCSACGGVGDLVCCETCPRSFHFDCVDLGINGGDLPDEWYCNVCTSKRSPPQPRGPHGGFGRLMSLLDRVNNQSFKLPHGVQTFFEGVKPGAGGDYEEITTAAPKPQKRKGYDDAPDFFKITDAEGAAVLCHNCQHASGDNRAIIPCSVCGLHWHLDCLEPPMAIPPVLRTWICPAHADDLLRLLPNSLGPAHKFRKIKNAPTIIPEYTRGMKNNGIIEVCDESEDESGWNDVRSFGRVYRLPAMGIKLDFIAQLRKQGAGYIRSSSPASQDPEQTVAQPVQDNSQRFSAQPKSRPIMEAQAALSLASLSAPSHGDGNDLNDLVDALMSNADDSVISLMARGDAHNIASGNLEADDKISLRAMLARLDAVRSQIQNALDATGPDPMIDTPAARNGRMHTPADATSPPPYGGTEDSTMTKTESIEADLPTPATIALDTIESVNGIIEKSSPANDSAMDLD